MSSEFPKASRIVILAAVDATDASEDVLRTSATLGQTLPGAEIHLLYVLEPMSDPDGRNAIVMPMTELIGNAQALLDRTTARAREHFTGRVTGHLAAGSPSREILQLAADLRADLIVVGPHRKKAFERWLLGSVSEQVVRKASCAVLVARPKEYANEGVPEIEPPCVDCLALQQETRGSSLWCSHHDHKRRHPQGRTHYETPATFAVGSLLIRPEG